MTEVIIFEADEPDMIVLESREPQPVILESDGGSGNATCIYTTPVTGPATSAGQVLVFDGTSYVPRALTADDIGASFGIATFNSGAGGLHQMGATVASGGFEGVAFDPRSPGTRVEYAHP